MKTLALMFTMLLSLALTLQGTAAQVGSDDSISADDIDGLIAGYSRSYIDNEEKRVQIYGYTFESKDQAEVYVSQTRDNLESEFEPNRESLDELKFEDMETIDADGFELTMTSKAENFALKILVFTDEDMVFVVLALDSDVESASETTEDYATYVLDSEIEDEDVAFDEHGTSTGGIFDRMPAADDKLVSEDAIVSDAELFAEDE